MATTAGGTYYAASTETVSGYPAISLNLANQLESRFAAKSDLAMVQNAQTGSSYSYALADASKLLTMSNASANTVLVTKQSTVTWVTGTQLRVMNLGAGVTTLVADTGVTINGNVALKQYQGGTLIRTASDVWLFVPTASSGGMDLITPTSVAGSGVTLSGGQVSISAASTVSANGVFSTIYENYLLTYSGVASADGDLQARLRVSGADNSAANYSYQVAYLNNATNNSARATGQTSFARIGGGNTDVVYLSIMVVRPFVAAATGVATQNIYTTTGGVFYNSVGLHTASTSFDSITIFPAAGTLTGSLRIYGLRNS